MASKKNKDNDENNATCCKGTFSDDDFGWNMNTTIQNRPLQEIFRPKNELQNEIIINVEEAATVLDFNLEDIHDEEFMESIEEKIPPKSKLVDLINPCTVESKALLSVVHYSLYKNFNPSMVKIEHLRDGVHLRYRRHIKNSILDGIINYPSYKDNEVLPLLVDLILTENKCDESEIIDNTQGEFSGGKEHSEKQKIQEFQDENVSEDSSVENEEWDNLRKKISKLQRQVKNMKDEVVNIKDDLEEETEKVNYLTGCAKIAEKDLRETKFLNDLIKLLNGSLDNITSKKTPFRCFLPSHFSDELNLIV